MSGLESGRATKLEPDDRDVESLLSMSELPLDRQRNHCTIRVMVRSVQVLTGLARPTVSSTTGRVPGPRFVYVRKTLRSANTDRPLNAWVVCRRVSPQDTGHRQEENRKGGRRVVKGQRGVRR